MIVGAPLRGTVLAPSADLAVLDRIGITTFARRLSRKGLEASPDMSVKRGEVGDAIILRQVVSPGGHDLGSLRDLLLQGPQQVRIEAELEDRVALGLAGQLGVDDLV